MEFIPAAYVGHLGLFMLGTCILLRQLLRWLVLGWARGSDWDRPPGCPGRQVLAYCGIGLVASILGELAAGVWRVPVDLAPQLGWGGSIGVPSAISQDHCGVEGHQFLRSTIYEQPQLVCSSESWHKLHKRSLMRTTGPTRFHSDAIASFRFLTPVTKVKQRQQAGGGQRLGAVVKGVVSTQGSIFVASLQAGQRHSHSL